MALFNMQGKNASNEVIFWESTTKDYNAVDAPEPVTDVAVVFTPASSGSDGYIESIFGRQGIIVAQFADYDTDEIENSSTLPGVTLSDALESINTSALTQTWGEVLSNDNTSDGYDLILTNNTVLKTPNVVSGAANAIQLTAGSGDSTGGGINILSGGANDTTGLISVQTATGGLNTGQISIGTGSFSTNQTGDLKLHTGANGINPGNLILQGGTSSPGNAAIKKGSIFLEASNATGSMSAAGDGYLIAGDSSSSTNSLAGTVKIAGGNTAVGATTGSGGNAIISSGSGKGGGSAGYIDLIGGNGLTGSAGGFIRAKAGNSNDANAGYVSLQAGNCSSGTGTGGGISLTAGNGNNDNGGNVNILSGSSVGGSSGNVNINSNGGNIVLTTTDTFIWPNTDGLDGYVLTTDASGNLYWSAGGDITVNTNIDNSSTSETDTSLVLKPDGVGGVEFVSPNVINVFGRTGAISQVQGDYDASYITNDSTRIPGAYVSNALDEIGIVLDGYAGGGGSGDVTGPASSTDNAIVVFDGITGKLVKNSGITIVGSNIEGSTIDGYNLSKIFGAQKDPSGFTNRADSTISVDDLTRTLTIQPTGVSYDILVSGDVITKSSADNIVFPDTEGLHFFWFDENGTITTSTLESDFANAIGGKAATIAALYWDQTNSETILFGEERHGLMDNKTHIHFHLAFGAQWYSGGQLGNIITNGGGNLDTHAQLSVSKVEYADEDIVFVIEDGLPQTLSPIANLPVYYREGAAGNWRKRAANSFPMIYSGDGSGYVGASGRLPYNENTGATWQLTEVGNNDYVLTHIFATNDINEPVIAIHGQNTYGSISDAQTGAETEINELEGTAQILSLEFIKLGTVILQTSNTFSNTPQAEIQPTAEGLDYIDFRGSSSRGGGSGSASNHGSLTGLSDDDHPQYLLTDGTRALTGNLNINSNDINNVGTIDGYTVVELYEGTGGGGGVTDHGALTGLADDDHTQYILANGIRAFSGNIDAGTNAIVNVGNVDGRDVSADGSTLDAHVANTSNPHSTDIGNLGSGTLAELNAVVSDATLDDASASRTPTPHSSTHIKGGADEIDGDRLDIDFTPSNYTPSTVPVEVTNVDDLSAHLAGIDNALGSAGGSGDVVGPASSTDNGIPTFDGTTGKLLQNTNARILDTGQLFVNGIATVNPLSMGGYDITGAGNITSLNSDYFKNDFLMPSDRQSSIGLANNATFTAEHSIITGLKRITWLIRIVNAGGDTRVADYTAVYEEVGGGTVILIDESPIFNASDVLTISASTGLSLCKLDITNVSGESQDVYCTPSVLEENI